MMIEAQKIDITTAPRHCGNPLLGAVPYSEVYLMDCVAGLRHYPDNYFDLAVVDPPYGIDIAEKLANGWVSKAGGTKFEAKDWDKYTPTQEYWDELFRVSKNQIVWGGNYFMSKIQRDSPCWIFWDKNNGDSLFADGEMAWTSFDSPIRLAKIHWCGSAAKHETGQNKIHPTQKPIKLYDWIFMKYAKQGDLILDTHVGSGSSRIAAHKAGLSFVGFEIDADYYAAQEKRFKTFTSQLRMF
jgi:site-specific DNA-methyltransferase (adenine-specific)